MKSPRAVAVVVRFEVARSGWVLHGSLLCCLAGFAAPVLPVFDFLDLHDAWRVAAFSVSAPLALLLLTPTLAITWTRGLYSGQIGFLYARPLTVGALWWGRCIASTVLTTTALGTSLLPALPWATATLLSSRDPEISSIGMPTLAYLTAVVSAAALLNAFVLMVRPPSGFTIAAFVLLLGTAGIIWLLHDWLEDLFSTSVYDIGLGTACLGVVSSLAVASWWQVRSGRVDALLAQRAFTTSLAVSLSVSLALPFGSIWWTLHPPPSALDLRWSYLAEPLVSDWVLISGLLKRRFEDGGVFLVHSPTGSWFRVYSGYIPHSTGVRQLIRFSEDGSLALASVPYVQPGSSPAVQVFDLVNRKRRSLTLSNAEGYSRPIAVLSSGRALLAGARALGVFDLTSGEHLCSSRVPLPRSQRHSWPIAGETPSGRVSILMDTYVGPGECPQSLDEQAVHFDVDPTTCEVERRSLCAPAGMASEALALDNTTGRALSITYHPDFPAPRSLRLHDLELGTSIDALILGDEPRYPNRADVEARFLDDDLIVATWEESKRARVAVLDKTGITLGLWTLPARRARLLARFEDDQILLALGELSWGEASLALLDVYSGTSRIYGEEVRLPASSPKSTGRLPATIVAVDKDSGQTVLLFRSGGSSPIPLRWHP